MLSKGWIPPPAQNSPELFAAPSVCGWRGLFTGCCKGRKNSAAGWMCEGTKTQSCRCLAFLFFHVAISRQRRCRDRGMAKQCFRFTACSNTLFLFSAGPVYRHQEPRQNAVSGQPCSLTSMWRPDYKFLAGRQALFQANAGDQRLHERFSFGKSIRLFPNIKSVLEKGLAGCLEFIQTGNKGVKGQGCPDTAFCRGS